MAVFVLLLSLAGSCCAATDLLLVDEPFDGPLETSTSVSPHWFDTTGGGFEVYPSGGASQRVLSTTYDHDANGSTPQVTIPGAIEVNDSAGTVTLTAEFTLPNNVDTEQTGLLKFFAAYRGYNAIFPNPTVSLTNVTDSRTVLAASNVIFNADKGIWQINTRQISLLAGDLGDTFRLNFYGGGSDNNNGLELTDVTFAVATVVVPTPAAATMGLLLLAGFGLGRRRDRLF
ncbi:hypothetical protein HED60_01915 [Planctomycetales bacterium ZRK34]|nr:hypothetical protein HED60_01915 [Planctomycetales bacterium ZRK34]